MRILMKNPSEVGADRIVNAVAAYETLRRAVRRGRLRHRDHVRRDLRRGRLPRRSHRAGIEVSLEALTARAARLVNIDVTEPPQVIGKSTVEALQSGAVYGFAGQVDGIVGAIGAEMGEDRVVATGGLADLIAATRRVIQTSTPS